jgi:hypothetical protein
MTFKKVLNKISREINSNKAYAAGKAEDIEADNFRPLNSVINRCGNPGNLNKREPSIFLPEGPNPSAVAIIPMLNPCPNTTFDEFKAYVDAHRSATVCPDWVDMPQILEANGINPESLKYPPYSNAQKICIFYERLGLDKFHAAGSKPCVNGLGTVPSCRCCCYVKSGNTFVPNSFNPTDYKGFCGIGGYTPGPILGD